jgi:hypothetical protein
MLLPFVSLPILGPVDGLSADAWPALLPLIPLTVLVLDNRSENGFDAIPAIAAVVLIAISLVFAAVKLADALVAARSVAGATLGPGPWVLLGAVVVAAGGALSGVVLRR